MIRSTKYLEKHCRNQPEIPQTKKCGRKRPKMYDVEITVISQKGKCSAGHKVGDNWVMGLYCPGGLCATAFDICFPFAKGLRFGAKYPFAREDGYVPVACSDSGNIEFGLKRIEK
jgi:uncharacterized repeat protein (TIGR04076 family)